MQGKACLPYHISGPICLDISVKVELTVYLLDITSSQVKPSLWGWRDGRAGRALALHTTDMGSISGTLCGPSSPPGVIPEHSSPAKTKQTKQPQVTIAMIIGAFHLSLALRLFSFLPSCFGCDPQLTVCIFQHCFGFKSFINPVKFKGQLAIPQNRKPC